ncbi:hypothetical protein B0G76_1078 [Paraburkholderia sp. BL23I1N1]|uniref:hypothetical protein n=1 Tax=Paraburkholderia sp. BL23I1N1 TaxID=1938802 RepID=UPI000E719A9C|nr:hypothetical protein [Paraburkholderia sp. BL23I1N1]RKE35031.1 hypothetical protein B0G76_1078 [Paraburkholderia sp. BL23I1N1]
MGKTSTDVFKPTAVPGGESAGLFDVVCHHVKEMTQARCAAVIVIDGESGSGYSVVGPLEAQVLLPDILVTPSPREDYQSFAIRTH